MKLRLLSLLSIVIVLSSCSTAGKKFTGDPDQIEVVIVQMNDVYELMPIAGKYGGLAKVAAVRNELLKKNPNVMTVLAGDFVNPSAIGAAVVDGKKLNGKQMVSSMNELGLDLTAFGNHEFDLDEADLFDRIAESKFAWLGGNLVNPETKRTFHDLDRSFVKTFTNGAGTEFRIGFVSATIASKNQKYVAYDDSISSIRSQVEQLKNKTDAILGLTHLEIETDMKIASEVSGLSLIMGGHEHFQMFVKRDQMKIPVAKADANALTVYVHVIKMNKKTGAVVVDSSYRKLDENAPSDPHMEGFTQAWKERAFAAYRAAGFEPDRLAFVTKKELDGRSSSVRSAPTDLTKYIAASIRAEIPGSELSLFNTGAVRIDDIIYPGNVTEYDVLRALPFGDVIYGTTVSGADLRMILDSSEKEKGHGMYLVSNGASKKGEQYFIGSKRLDPKKTYKIAINSYMKKSFSKAFASEPFKTGRDMRRAFIEYMKAQSK